MLLRKIGASLWIPIIIVAFGLVTTLTAFIKNFTKFMLVHVALRIAEGGLMQVSPLGVLKLLTTTVLGPRTYLFSAASTIGKSLRYAHVCSQARHRLLERLADSLFVVFCKQTCQPLPIVDITFSCGSRQIPVLWG